MSLFVLDTDHLTLLRAGQPNVVAHVTAVSAAQMAITIITVDEQLTGWYAQVRKARDPVKLARAYDKLFEAVDALKGLNVLRFSLPTAQRYFALRRQLPRLGKMDLAIAATVLEMSGTLVTRNQSDFRQVPQLALEDWTKP
jgi:tRNA(fMet)-specific endonuclease VapC